MERNGSGREEGLSPQEVEIVKRVNELLDPHSISQSDLDSDQFDGSTSVEEHLKGPPGQAS